MAIQQMGLMAYKAPPAGGGDSAFLKQGFFAPGLGNTSIAQISITFNVGGGVNAGYVDYVWDSSDIFVWKTGTGIWTDYRARFTKTANTGTFDIAGSAVNTWILMGSSTPSWSLDATDTASQVEGYLAIDNSTNPGVELANVFLQLTTNTSA